MNRPAMSPPLLQGARVTLEPLTLDHIAPLTAAGLHPELWALQPKAICSEADMRDYVEQALNDHARGTALPFAVVHRATQTVVGATRFMDMALPHRRVEIGATWYAPSVQGTGVNAEAKLLLLTHAFETLRLQKVVLKTETLNTRSRAAILALGATEEGIFRRHFIAESGRLRDMVYFSILDYEWAVVRANLEARLRKYGV